MKITVVAAARKGEPAKTNAADADASGTDAAPEDSTATAGLETSTTDAAPGESTATAADAEASTTDAAAAVIIETKDPNAAACEVSFATSATKCDETTAAAAATDTNAAAAAATDTNAAAVAATDTNAAAAATDTNAAAAAATATFEVRNYGVGTENVGCFAGILQQHKNSKSSKKGLKAAAPMWATTGKWVDSLRLIRIPKVVAAEEEKAALTVASPMSFKEKVSKMSRAMGKGIKGLFNKGK